MGVFALFFPPGGYVVTWWSRESGAILCAGSALEGLNPISIFGRLIRLWGIGMHIGPI